MPELPEVETVRRGLNKLIIGKQVKDLKFDWPKSFPNDQLLVSTKLIDSSVTAISRRAKVLILELSSGYALVIHLKMTGQLVFRSHTAVFGGGHPNESLVGKLPDNSTRVTITFADGSKLFFNDQRKFGWMRLLPSKAVMELSLLSSAGPEPLAEDFNWRELKVRLGRRPNSGIKAVLLDQKIIAGIGNIYADESLWAAKIHPLTPVKLLTDKGIKHLHQAIVDVLELSIKQGGSTDRNYVNAEGGRGRYLKFANVFRKDGQACPRCGRTIEKIRAAGRGTHLCPFCQRLKQA